MKNLKISALAALVACISTPVFAKTDLNQFITDSIKSSDKVHSLELLANNDQINQRSEEMYYIPTIKAGVVASTNFKKDKKGKLDFNGNKAVSQTFDLRTTLWSDSVSDRIGLADDRFGASKSDVLIQKNNIKAQLTTTLYSIKLYEDLIKEGKIILTKAENINKNIIKKVDGGLAKSSDKTTSKVLLSEMDNAILATSMKIKQLKLSAEQVSGMKYPTDIRITDGEIAALISTTPSSTIENNYELQKKSFAKDMSRRSVGLADSWIGVDAYARTKYDVLNTELQGKDTEFGIQVNIDIFDPSKFWKKRTAANQYKSESYSYDQMRNDLAIGLESQKSILKSNIALLESEKESIKIKRKLIRERQNEYEINVTSLYELIQSWNSYYTAVQQMTDTKVTILNTIMSIKVMTGDL
ncbi:TolC family protein [Photobacterium kishitanii]|uniref:TolC family protein n=1 Tax=Photobacterium kishitanii TaxID=318456 RepID=A0A2T3KM52_9GAMM|nr:TolC family protein [Photobacterium kishitanii]PSV00887.1 hypothetical protein C9J27_02340 [Photobacterium kishitanii]